MKKNKQIFMFYPFVPKEAILGVKNVLESRWVGQGNLIDEFEKKLKKYFSLDHLIAVNNSASAIRLALSLVNVKPNDEVITTPLTCTLTNHPILEQFAKPVFADIQIESGNINPGDIKKKITSKTKAVVCTHWGGTPCDMDEIKKISSEYNIPVIEDASEALGAKYKKKQIGTISRFTAFSFQAIQLLTTGEGGALTVLNKKDEKNARLKRWFGIDRENRIPNSIGYYDFDINMIGFGYHMTNISASMGLASLPYLKQLLKRKKEIVSFYYDKLKSVPGVILLKRYKDRESSNHFFTILVPKREDFYRKMKNFNIETSIVHERNDKYSIFGGRRLDLPNLDIFSKQYINLPCHSHLNDEDLNYIVSTIKSGW